METPPTPKGTGIQAHLNVRKRSHCHPSWQEGSAGLLSVASFLLQCRDYQPGQMLPFQHLATPVPALQLNQRLVVRTNWAQSGHALGHRQEKCQPWLREPRVNGLGIWLHLLAWASQELPRHVPLPDDSLRQGWDNWKTATWTPLEVSVSCLSACFPLSLSSHSPEHAELSVWKFPCTPRNLANISCKCFHFILTQDGTLDLSVLLLPSPMITLLTLAAVVSGQFSRRVCRRIATP